MPSMGSGLAVMANVDLSILLLFGVTSQCQDVGVGQSTSQQHHWSREMSMQCVDVVQHKSHGEPKAVQ